MFHFPVRSLATALSFFSADVSSALFSLAAGASFLTVDVADDVFVPAGLSVLTAGVSFLVAIGFLLFGSTLSDSACLTCSATGGAEVWVAAATDAGAGCPPKL